MSTPIWTGNDVTVFIYAAGPDGEKLSEIPLFSHCFMQDCKVSGQLNYERRPVTGRPKKKIVAHEWGEYEMSVGHFYLSKDIELDLDEVFHREKLLLIEMVCLHEGDNPDNAETHTLKMAKACDFAITSNDNQNVLGTAKFCAEEFE